MECLCLIHQIIETFDLFTGKSIHYYFQIKISWAQYFKFLRQIQNLFNLLTHLIHNQS